MAQDLTQKQAAYVRRFTAKVTDLLDVVGELAELQEEYQSLGYAPGAPPVGGVAWNITDDAVQSVLPSGTAEQVQAAMGGVQSVREVVEQNQGYLQPMRP